MSATPRAQARLAWTRDALGDAAATLEPASADASFRSYWRAHSHGTSWIVMDAPPEREAVEQAMVGYMERRAAEGVPWPNIARHMMGLWHGVAGARRWRQIWSDHRLKERTASEVHRFAAAALAPALADVAL